MRGRGRLVAVAVIGLGLAAAPAAFQMFSRAPKGGDMLDEFRPYMTEAKVAQFRGYMAEIGAADGEAGRLPLEGYPAVADWHEQWKAIDADMGDMLDRIDRNIDNYEAVDALPPFPLFPWFFVIPGVLALVLAVSAVRRSRAGGGRGLRWVLVALGVGLIAAPAVFQMFTRAPKGGDMIDDFQTLMTERKVTSVQGYFLTIGAAEGQLRNQTLPELGERAGDVPATRRFMADWPTISAEMAPMIGDMSNNVDNFEAVDALPPFPLFPWFFVIPGVLVAVLAVPRRVRS